MKRKHRRVRCNKCLHLIPHADANKADDLGYKILCDDCYTAREYELAEQFARGLITPAEIPFHPVTLSP